MKKENEIRKRQEKDEVLKQLGTGLRERPRVDFSTKGMKAAP